MAVSKNGFAAPRFRKANVSVAIGVIPLDSCQRENVVGVNENTNVQKTAVLNLGGEASVAIT